MTGIVEVVEREWVRAPGPRFPETISSRQQADLLLNPDTGDLAIQRT